MSDIKYFTFPVLLLKDFFNDKKTACNQMLHYAVYAHSKKLNEGSELDKIKSSAKFHEVSMGNPKTTLEKGKILYDSIPGNIPMTSINVNTVFQFRDDYKTDFEIISFLAFAAIKSILGKRPYLKINDSALFARMTGLSGLTIPPDEIPEHLLKLTKRYHRDKLLNELAENWNLTTYARYTRGYYVSNSMDYENLGFEVEKNRQIKKQNHSKKEANARIMARLKPP